MRLLLEQLELNECLIADEISKLGVLLSSLMMHQPVYSVFLLFPHLHVAVYAGLSRHQILHSQMSQYWPAYRVNAHALAQDCA